MATLAVSDGEGGDGGPAMAKPEDRKRIFELALSVSGAARREILDRECGGDVSLRAELEGLLLRADRTKDGSEAPTVAVESIPVNSAGQVGGTTIGPYTLMRLIGEGGFGSVYLAEQTEPVRRRVALKIIKLGMDTQAVIGRFEQERQALAVMDHPAHRQGVGCRHHRRREAVLRDGAGRGPADFGLCGPASAHGPRSDWSSSARSATESSTPTARGSSTATSSRATSSSRPTTAGRSPG